MHRFDAELERLAAAVLDYALQRQRLDPVPLDGPVSPADLEAAVGATITPDGLGGLRTLELFAEHLAPACISVDHPRYLAFIPAAPTEASTLFDLVVGVSSIYGGSWLEGAGAVYAENQALRWVADLAGLPAAAGGVFVPGGTTGNLSALVAARHRAAGRLGGAARPQRWIVVGSTHTHASVATACAVMDADYAQVPVGPAEPLTGAALSAFLDAMDPADRDGVFAVVATGGTTNLGIVEDLATVADVCAAYGLWLHVDAAYGGAALAAPSARARFGGIERADSLVVDPHKWLFAPFDCCALLYRDPAQARAAHAQRAGYLEPLHASAEWNPSDYAIGLTRRARGLPFWFSLATHGTRAYTAAVERTLDVARYTAAAVRRRAYLDLIREPDLSVVPFRRVGWASADYEEWSARLLRDGFAFVLPTTHEGRTVARIAVTNPRTTEADVDAVLDTMA